MAPKDTEVQGDIAAIPNTKRGLGLWRGSIIHPADDRLPEIKDAIRRGAEPITCAKGLVKLSPVRASIRGATAHFRVNDPDYTAKIDSSYPEFHHAAVRVIANYLSAEGYDGLRRLCYSTCLPEKVFTVGAVTRERVFNVSGVIYRPDIVVEPSEAGYPRIELEVVNTHGPGEERLKAARAERALVLWMNIRDLVEKYVADDRRALVPDDETLLSALLRLWFTAPTDRESYAAASLARWRDLDQAKYMRYLRESLRDAEATVAQSLKIARSIAAGESLHLRPTNDENYVYRELMTGVHASKSGEIERLLDHYKHATVMPDETREALTDLREAHSGLKADVRVLESLLNIVFRMLQERWLRARKSEEDARRAASEEAERMRRASELRAEKRRAEAARQEAERAEAQRRADESFKATRQAAQTARATILQAAATHTARNVAVKRATREAESDIAAAALRGDVRGVASKHVSHLEGILSRAKMSGDARHFGVAARAVRITLFESEYAEKFALADPVVLRRCREMTDTTYVRDVMSRMSQ